MIVQKLLRIPLKLKESLEEAAKPLGLTLNGLIITILWDWTKKQ